MDAACAGEKEFRDEARKVIESGKGDEMARVLEDMANAAPAEAQESMKQVAASVKLWVSDPSTLEDGGRYIGCGGGLGGFGCHWPGYWPGCWYPPYYPYYPSYPCYPYNPCGGIPYW
jgi:hypothetical protein